jgi:hypothetical protein
MPHYKCVACKSRLHSAGSPADDVGDLCPGCGAPLEPVGELAEIVGFRSIKPGDNAPDGDAPILALRKAIRAQARRDAERWLDDGGSFNPEAVAEEMALPVLPPSVRLETRP